MSAATAIHCKRVYDPPGEADGTRVLVDRLWPRGLSKEKAAVDHWLKAVAPSNELRRWFGHKPERWEEFQRRYREELATPERREALAQLHALADRGPADPALCHARDRAQSRHHAGGPALRGRDHGLTLRRPSAYPHPTLGE